MNGARPHVLTGKATIDLSPAARLSHIVHPGMASWACALSAASPPSIWGSLRFGPSASAIPPHGDLRSGQCRLDPHRRGGGLAHAEAGPRVVGARSAGCPRAGTRAGCTKSSNMRPSVRWVRWSTRFPSAVIVNSRLADNYDDVFILYRLAADGTLLPLGRAYA